MRSRVRKWLSVIRFTAAPRPDYLFPLEAHNIGQIAKNCRTGVAMTEKYYAAHIKAFARRCSNQPHAAGKEEKSKLGGLTNLA
jgi:hypothetical protein